MPPEQPDLRRLIASLIDPAWYRLRYPDVVAANLDPVAHFEQHGAMERRDPNPFFDSAWYAKQYPDVESSGLAPLSHYLLRGVALLRNPHPRFDTAWYVRQYPDAATNPLLYHMRIGHARGYPAEKPIEIRDYLPSENPPPTPPRGIFVDIVVPVFRSIEQARCCLMPILAGRTFPLARVITFEDPSTRPPVSAWLRELAADGQVYLIRSPRRLDVAACFKRGIEAAETHDVVLLQGDTQVSPDSLCRMAAHAWSAPRIATVSPLSNDSADRECGLSGFDYPPSLLDETCRTVNAGRSVQIPAASDSCLYVRCDAVHAAGGFSDDLDASAAFSRRAAAAGWQHRLACDTFAWRDAANRASLAPDPDRVPAPADPFHFAVTAALFRRSGLPVILMVSHNLGGGIRRHINALATRYAGKAHVFLLAGTDRGAALSVPADVGHPVLRLPPDRIEDLVTLLRSAGVCRVHIHHLLYMDMDIRRLIHRLGVPFDVTVHDYYTICPQVNLLRWPEGLYCGEPDRGSCNACIAEFSSHYAKEILSWRREQEWQFIEADRVICPSADVQMRLARYGIDKNTLVAPHEEHRQGDWPVNVPQHAASPLRTVLLGVLANHKGARIVASVAEAAEPGSLAIHLIGHLEASFPKPTRRLIDATGPYQEQDLDTLVKKANPHVFWFPSTAPETYSYTLTTAIETGLPIVATNLGSFPERLAGRPNTWLVPHDATPQDWLAVFDDVRNRVRNPGPTPSIPRAALPSGFYDTDYLIRAPRTATRRVKPRIVVLPERLPHGDLTPCAYIRLLQPLDHPAIGDGFEILLADTDTVFNSDADIVVTQRHAIPNVETADRVAAHVRRIGAKLVYDLDDDLLNIPANHPDADQLRPKAEAVRRMLTLADAVWLSTAGLAARLARIRPDARVIENRLDERIWTAPPDQLPYWDDPVRILCMGTSTHDADFAIIEPALARLKADHGERIVIDVLGMTRPRELSPGLNRIGPSSHATRSYPGFVNWITGVRPVWHVGMAPLRDTLFNRSKSPIKALDYAAMGLAVLASDVPTYRGSLADGPAGQLIANDPHAWHAALDWMIRDQDLRRATAKRARAAFVARGTLASQAEERLAAWISLMVGRLPSGPAALTIRYDENHSAT